MKKLIISAGIFVLASSGPFAAAETESAKNAKDAVAAHRAPNSSSRTISDGFQNNLPTEVPLKLDLPDGYEVYETPNWLTGGFIWADREDWKDIEKTQGKPTQLKRGVFNARLSTNVSYDPKSEKFSGEDSIEEALKANGATNTKVEKFKAKDHTVFLLSATLGKRNSRMAYISLGKGTIALIVKYFNDESWTSEDDNTWQRFVNGLKAT